MVALLAAPDAYLEEVLAATRGPNPSPNPNPNPHPTQLVSLVAEGEGTQP